MLDDKPVTCLREVKKIVTAIFKDNESGGYKNIYHRAQDRHAGLTQNEIRKVMRSRREYRLLSLGLKPLESLFNFDTTKFKFLPFFQYIS